MELSIAWGASATGTSPRVPQARANGPAVRRKNFGLLAVRGTLSLKMLLSAPIPGEGARTLVVQRVEVKSKIRRYLQSQKDIKAALVLGVALRLTK